MRRLPLALALASALVATNGCGSRFDLPTEAPGGAVPSDQSYGMIATWTGLDGIQDVLLTQGSGTQLFMLFRNDGSGGPDVPRGDVRLYPLTKATPIGAPYFSPLATLFNPLALASAQNKLYVLDQGDTCLAKYDAVLGTCEADVAVLNPRRSFVRDLRATWRVREYGLGGGDTISTFTDTSLAVVHGVAAGEDGSVYVAGVAVVLDTNAVDQRIRTRKFASRLYRYVRGPKYPGIYDVNMPGANWHRDTTWLVLDGSGTGSVSGPRGLYFSRYGAQSLFVADAGNNQVKELSVASPNLGLVKVDGQTTGANFSLPTSVRADLAGFFYVVDRSNQRVLRYDRYGEFVQRVDIENNAQGEPVLDPVSIAADDSLAYVADRGRGKVIRFKRRS